MKKIKFKDIIITVIYTFLIGYFSYHAINGQRGVLSLLEFSSKLNKLKAELDEKRAERLKLEHQVNLLHANSLDLDLLEERAKAVLSHSKTNEIVVITDENKKAD